VSCGQASLVSKDSVYGAKIRKALAWSGRGTEIERHRQRPKNQERFEEGDR